jgi:CRISPR-associated protein Cas2
MMRYVVTYDIADDSRREDASSLLPASGRRVHLAVFECDLRSRREAALRESRPGGVIDPLEDHVRLCSPDACAPRQVSLTGTRTLEERQDFRVVA